MRGRPGEGDSRVDYTGPAPPGFRSTVRNRVGYEGTEKDLDGVIVMNHLKKDGYIGKKCEVDHKEASRKVADKGYARRSGKKQKAQDPAVAPASKPIVRVPVERCWHCKGPYLKIHGPQLNGGKQEGGGEGGLAHPRAGARRGLKARQGLGKYLLLERIRAKTTACAVFSHSPPAG